MSNQEAAKRGTAEQQWVQETHNQATEYARRRLDTTGVDGKPLYHALAVSIIQNVSNEGVNMLAESLARKKDGETTDETRYGQALILIRMADEAMFREALRVGNPDEISRALSEVKRDNILFKD